MKQLKHAVLAVMFSFVLYGLVQDCSVSFAADNATETVSAQVKITPRTYNVNRNGRYVNGIIVLPAGYRAADVAEESIWLHLLIEDNETAEGIQAVRAIPVPFVDNMLNVKFDNREMKELIETYYDEFPATVRVSVSGSIDNDNGTSFTGHDAIYVVAPGKKKKGQNK